MLDPKTQLTEQLDVARERGSRFAERRYSSFVLAGISFVEAALLVPIVTDPFLVAYIISRPKRAVFYVIITSVASILGGVFAYASAFWFYDVAVQPLLSTAQNASLQATTHALQDNTFFMTLIGAFTPVPYTITAMAAGFVHGSIVAFLAASVLGRGVRYAIIGWLTYRYGEVAIAIARRHIIWFSVLTILLVAAFVWYKMQ